MLTDIQYFVREALARGQSKDSIAAALAKAGWPEDDARSALAAYADVDFPVPVPRPRPYLSAREAFLYLVLFTCLYISAFNFGVLLFQFIERAFPDALNAPYGYDGSLSAIRFSVSALIIAFPLYLWLTRLFARAFAKDPAKRGSKIRKWLSYITLFIAASVIIGDLIALIFNLLGGELTTRFFLKMLSILLIAGMIFGYYLWELRQDEKEA
jgi:hypothetical protein